MNQKLSVKEFENELRNGLQQIAAEKKWDLNKQNEQGYAFQFWVARLLTAYDRGLETEPEDGMLFSRDLKADFVLEDSTLKNLTIAQCKYLSLSKRPPINESDVNDFFNRHDQFVVRDWVLKHGSEAAKELLGDYQEKVADGYSVNYYFFTTGAASERIKELADNCTQRFAQRGLQIRCFLVDFDELKDMFIRAQSLEESLPNDVTIQIPEGNLVEKFDPYQTVIAVIKGNALRDLYKRYKEALFAWNIRGYLGNRGVNNEIVRTATEQPEHFFYFNNGVTALCTDYEIKNSNTIVAKNFQIINGAQTVGALGRAKANPNVNVLFRLTKTISVKTDKGINSEIIRFNNTQNVIKLSDFRANDQIQRWLERRFKEYKWDADFQNITYAAKRGSVLKRLPGARSISFEELAKIRYTFQHEPTLVLSSPKELWTTAEDNGQYEKAFGIAGELLDAWPDDEFNACAQAVGFYVRIDEVTRKEGRDNPELKYLNRLRFHAIALAGMYARALDADGKALPKGERGVTKAWEVFWPETRRVLIDAHITAVEEQGSTMYAFARSAERWEGIKKRFIRNLKLTVPN